MGKRLTPIERFLAEEVRDRRQAYVDRLHEREMSRVNIIVPTKYADAIKTAARVLRHSPDWVIEQYRRDLDEYLADSFAAMDEDIASGRFVDVSDGPERTERSEDAPRRRRAKSAS